jgi:ring-1,2-phenylacetyl-CoA epoxidase subunit PaaE
MSIKFSALPIKQFIDETPDAYTMVLPKPAGEQFNYQPGQYLTFKVNVNGEELRRAFSLSSSPVADDHLSVTIKRVEGGRVSNYLRDHLKPGDELQVLPPMGNFKVELNASNRNNYVLIGGGSGITPLMSILKSVLQEEPNSIVTLWYCNRDKESVIFRDQLEQLRQQYGDRLSVFHTLTRPSADWQGPSGRLDTAMVYQLLSDLFMNDEHRKLYYLCGPNGLMDAAEAALDKHAVNPADINREYYSAPAPTVDQVSEAYGEGEGGSESGQVDDYELKEQKVIITLDDETTEVTVKATETVLEAAMEAGLDPPFACQSGICTTCRAMLKSGVVSMDEAEGLSEDEIEEGYILTCQSHPLTADVEIDYD